MADKKFRPFVIKEKTTNKWHHITGEIVTDDWLYLTENGWAIDPDILDSKTKVYDDKKRHVSTEAKECLAELETLASAKTYDATTKLWIGGCVNVIQTELNKIEVAEGRLGCDPTIFITALLDGIYFKDDPLPFNDWVRLEYKEGALAFKGKTSDEVVLVRDFGKTWTLRKE